MRPPGCLGELNIGKPLQPCVKGDALRSFGAKTPDFVRMRRTKSFRPFAQPVPSLLAEMFGERLECGVRLQSLSARAPERFEGVLVAGGLEMRP
jgi:hypothetical protein